MAILRFAVLVLIAGCSEPPACYEGDYRACTCDDGKPGFAACDVATSEYGVCGSCGQVPGLVSSSGGAGGGGGSAGAGGAGGTELLGFMETCTANEECETGLCHTYNAKGMKCSMPCQTDGECPAPSPGCNNMGVCKAP